MRGEPGAKCPHEAYFLYYGTNELQAVRSGKWKLMLPHTYRTMQGQPPGKDGTPGKYRTVKIEKPATRSTLPRMTTTMDTGSPLRHPNPAPLVDPLGVAASDLAAPKLL